MSLKGFVIALSVVGSTIGVGCWIFAGHADKPTPSDRGKSIQTARVKPYVLPLRESDSKRQAAPAIPPTGTNAPRPSGPPSAAASQALTAEELSTRAARVEQEANHDLRRLVELLELDEGQQDKVFQTLARHSPSWTPGMQFAPATSDMANPAGRRGDVLSAAPGGFTTVPPSPAPATTPTKSPGESTVPASADPLDEIMALLSPDQQDTLLQEEIDRAAWWAEVLEQITPADDVPAIDGSAPAAGDTKAYEGSDVLE